MGDGGEIDWNPCDMILRSIRPITELGPDPIIEEVAKLLGAVHSLVVAAEPANLEAAVVLLRSGQLALNRLHGAPTAARRDRRRRGRRARSGGGGVFDDDVYTRPSSTLLCYACLGKIEGFTLPPNLRHCSAELDERGHIRDEFERQGKHASPFVGTWQEAQAHQSARHYCYIAVHRDAMAGEMPPNAGFYVSDCVALRARRRFPSPWCGEGCDFLHACEAAGHYPANQTSKEMRMLREEQGKRGERKKRVWKPLWD